MFFEKENIRWGERALQVLERRATAACGHEHVTPRRDPPAVGSPVATRRAEAPGVQILLAVRGPL
ncbi:hypothetical protein [Streptomyces sp. SAI-170]|uniref:hypothetical protein n=1 Tax=Streptomyces sp. SAI-170 TaxID=3377729 RepID=UPI003C7E3DBA